MRTSPQKETKGRSSILRTVQRKEELDEVKEKRRKVEGKEDKAMIAIKLTIVLDKHIKAL